MSKKVLVVIAHPDDETIWMGGTLLRNSTPKKWKTTIVSLCRKNDPDRAPKFKKVCNIYNAKNFMFDLDDEKMQDVPIKKIIDILKIFGGKYDYVFTHGKNGEYGHKRHVEINKAVEKMVEKKLLNCKTLYLFHYKKGENIPFPRLVPSLPIMNTDLVVKLNKNEFTFKKKIIREIYSYPNKKGFELMSCNNKESFKRYKRQK